MSRDDIFDIVNEQVVININCLLIPELKALNDKFGEDISAFSYVHYMTDLGSPYYNDDKTLQSEEVLRAFPGSYKPTDKEVCDAFNFLYQHRVKNNVVIRRWEATRAMANKISDYMFTSPIDDSKESGNLVAIQRIMDKSLQNMQDFLSINKIKNEEQAKARGSQEIAYDQ